MAASSSNNEITPPQYQVFINFRGVELRNSFVDLLVKTMETKKVNVFIDESELKGRSLDYLFKRIEESRVAVAIFSEKYTESHWCLDELVKMKEQMEESKLVVIPIFYKLEPADCKNLEGAFGSNFKILAWDYQTTKPETVKKWVEAIKTICRNHGWTLGSHSKESNFANSIVEEVKRVLKYISTKENATIGGNTEILTNKTQIARIGVQEPLEQLEKKLEFEREEETRFIGVFGSPGIGKTTLAKMLHEKSQNKFERSLFIPDVSKMAIDHGIVWLQRDLLQELVKDIYPNVEFRKNPNDFFLFISSSSADFLIQQVTEGRGIESINTSYSLEANIGVTRVLRHERPSSKIVTITSFSVIKERGEPYESSVFEAAGYKWRLVLYVNGNQTDGGKYHISLYVRIEETESLRRGLEVNVDLKLFVYNGKQFKYLTVTDGLVKRFSAAKKEWGFGQLIPHSIFFNTKEGYIEQDTASFGAEIFVVKPAQIQEKVIFISNPLDNIFTWKIPDFSTLEDKFYYSEDFLVEDRYWRLGYNPKGNGGGIQHALPIFLYAQGHKENAVATNTFGGVYLRLKNQRTSNHRQIESTAWYPIRSGSGMGVTNIILFSDLNDASKGYLVNDSIIFEAEMFKVSVTNIVSA